GQGTASYVGKGQHTTTRAFAESSNTLYAGGGGGGAQSRSGGNGGAGGGVMDKAIQITVPPVSQEPAAVAAVVSMPVVLPVAEVLL
ncbi:MAG: hypothetical protein ACLTC4_22410, partial [Hungatella hathewayi]